MRPVRALPCCGPAVLHGRPKTTGAHHLTPMPLGNTRERIIWFTKDKHTSTENCPHTIPMIPNVGWKVSHFGNMWPSRLTYFSAE